MKVSENSKILFVINPGSGAGNTDWKKEITNFFSDKKHQIDFILLPKGFDAENIKQQVAKFSPDILGVVGGDGTITTIAGIANKLNLPLAVFPGGSANGLAKELNIPNDPIGCLEYFLSSSAMCHDAIDINGKICLHLGDIGMNAQLIKYYDENNIRGKLGYAKVLMKMMVNKIKIPLTLFNDKNTIERTALMVVLANASKYGTGLVINAQGKINDGMFEVVIVKKVSARALLRLLFFGGRFNPNDVEVYSAQELNIRTKKRTHFQVDGEYYGKTSTIKARILPGYVKVFMKPY